MTLPAGRRCLGSTASNRCSRLRAGFPQLDYATVGVLSFLIIVASILVQPPLFLARERM